MKISHSVLWLMLSLWCSALVGADAATVGAWTRLCSAANLQTGVVQPVAEVNVNDPSSQYYGFTSVQPDGSWIIKFNIARILSNRLITPTVLKFLFFHECSHAQFKTSDEHIADCQGLAALNADISVTPSILAEISAVYRSVGRSFPSGGPC